MSTKTLTLLVLGLILLVPITYNSYDLPSNIVNNSNKGYKLASLTVSDPISITSDSDFSTLATAYGWSGNGSSSNPYIIENLQIVNATNNTNGISIDGIGITKHFIIRNNYIEMTGSGSIGIYLHYINNLGTIENNTLYNNTMYGLELYSSSTNTVSNNIISKSGSHGIYSYVSSSTTIEYNTITENNASALRFFGSSSYNIIQHNNMSYNDEGIFYSSSNNDIIYNNTFSHNLNYAIHTGSSLSYTNVTDNVFSYMGNSIMYFQSSTSYLIFSGNTFEYNSADGVRFGSGSTNNTFYDNSFLYNQYGIWSNIGQSYVYNNTFIGNTYGLNPINSLYGTYENNTFINNQYAIKLTFSDNNTFLDNNIINNSYGIDVVFSDNNTFYGNNLLHNSVQASVSYADNYFDNGSFGNFWLDYVTNAVDTNKDGIGDSSYLVSSSSGNVYDNYPLMVWNNESLPLEFLKTVSNVTYSEGNAINYTWKLVDESPDTYVIYKDGSAVQSGSWLSFLSDEYINTTLPQSLGLYNYTIVVNDTDGNIVTDTAFVNVIDIIAPTINGYTYYSYNESTPGQFINWNVTDNHPDYYTVYKDGVVIDNNTWTANSTITVDVSGLLKGNYNYTIIANDTSNNINMLTTIVNVYDGTPPNITSYGNQTYEGGSTDVNINWTAADNYPAYYEIYNNSVLIVNNTWTSNVNISQVISSLSLGQFNFTIIVYDQSGNNITSTIYVTFVDTTPPVITSYPANNTIDISYSGWTVNWSAMDFFPSQYTLYDNNSVFATGNWITDTVNFNLDSLSVGMHNLTISFNDTSGNLVSNTVWVQVITDTVPPTITSQPVVAVFQDIQSGKSVSWTAIDDKHPNSYTLYINGTATVSGTWLNNTAVVIPFSGLPAGVYNFTIYFNDTIGNLASNTVWITIFADVSSPKILSAPINTTFTDVSTGNNFSWQVIDDYGPDQFVINVDGVLFASGTWTNNSIVTKNFDGLPAGMHHIEAYFNDTSNNTAYSDFWITVTSTDSIAPVIVIQPLTTTFQDIQSGKSVSWTATDNFAPNKYSLYINGSLYSNGNWLNNTATVIPFNGLIAGVYNFTIYFNDTAGNTVSNTVFITIFSDTTPPQTLSSPTNTTFADVSTGNYFYWQVIDNIGADHYAIFVDGVLYTSNTWINNSIVTENMDSLPTGVHHIETYFNDTSNNTVYSDFWITVTYTDNIAPNIISYPSSTTFKDITPEKNVSWTAIDDYQPGKYSVYVNNSLYTSGSWQNATAIVISFNGLPVGFYNFTIACNDTTGNTAYNIVLITIISDTTAPILTGPSNLSFDYGSTGKSLDLHAFDTNPDTFEIYQNGSLIKSGNWVSNVNITLDLDSLQLNPGTYNFSFCVFDTFGNVAYHFVILTVNQVQTPTTTSTTPTTSTSSSTPSTSKTSDTSRSSQNSSGSTTTISQQLSSSWNIAFLLLSFSLMILIRSKRK